jgi:hypothetical protein
MRSLSLFLSCCICLASGLAVYAEHYRAYAESAPFRLVTGETIVQRTVSGDSVYLRPLEGVEGVPTVNGVVIEGWSAENPYWDTTTLADGAYTLEYGGSVKQVIVSNHPEIPGGESAPFTLELRDGVAGSLATGAVRVASLNGSVSRSLLVDGRQAVGWRVSSPEWDSTSVVDGWHTLRLGDREANLLVLNSPEVEFHGGAVDSSEYWDADKLHLVRHWVRPAAGTRVSLAPYATVKFLSDTGFCNDVGEVSEASAALLEYTEDAIELYSVEEDTVVELEDTGDGKILYSAPYGTYELRVPWTPSLEDSDDPEDDDEHVLAGNTAIYYTLNGSTPTRNSARLAESEEGASYEPITFTISKKAPRAEIRLAWLEEVSGKGKALYEPNWGFLGEGRVLRTVTYQVESTAPTGIPVTVNGGVFSKTSKGKSMTVTATGIANGETLWRASDAGKAIFTGWTNASLVTSGKVTHPLTFSTKDALNRASLTFTVPADAASINLKSAQAILPAFQGYLDEPLYAKLTLKTLEGEKVSLEAYDLGALSAKIRVKPVFEETLDDALLDTCDVEYCFTSGNDDDSSVDFGYDTYDYEVLGDLRSILSEGISLSVKATAVSGEDAIRQAPRLLLRIRQRYTGVTFGYRIHAFVCPNYILVNGKPVFAKPGQTLELNVAAYLPVGGTLLGWSSTAENLDASYDLKTGVITLVVPEDGQVSLTIDGTKGSLDTLLFKWTVSLEPGWNLISTGIYDLDDESLERFLEHTPWVHVNGQYIPMEDFLPAHAYWVHADQAEEMVLSGTLQ